MIKKFLREKKIPGFKNITLQVHIYDLIFIKINFSLASTVLENHL
jgi:hypothetical protein